MTQPLPEPPRRGHVYVMPSPVNSSCETPSSVQSDGSRGSSLFVAGDLLNNVQNSISRERNNYARVVQSASINSALLAATGQPGFGLFPVGLTPLAEDKSDPFTCLGPAVHPVAMMRGPLVQAVLSNTPSPATSGLSGLRQVPHVNGLGRSAEDSSQVRTPLFAFWFIPMCASLSLTLNSPVRFSTSHPSTPPTARAPPQGH